MIKRNSLTVSDEIKFFEDMSFFFTELIGEDCLHMGFRETTDLVAAEAGIDKSKYVLEVCSGLGGSSMYIASKCGCNVVGLDITAKSVEYAKEKAEEKGVHALVEFHVGNALDMPFPPNHFDAAFSEDSLCHVMDKGKVIDEMARVLKPGGTFCFTDYVWSGEGEISDEFLNDVCIPWAWPYLETMDGYKEHFKRNGLELVGVNNRTDFMKDVWKEMLSVLQSKKDHIIKTYGGQEAYDGSIQILEALQKYTEASNLETWMFPVRKPL